MTKREEIEALRQEIAELRAQVAELAARPTMTLERELHSRLRGILPPHLKFR